MARIRLLPGAQPVREWRGTLGGAAGAMGAFDHIILLLSFVYALAIGHLLTTTAMLIRRAAEVRFSALNAFWMLNALVVIMANWLSFWDLRTLPSWSVATIFFTFLIAFTNYLQAALACPETGGSGLLDLVEFQARQHARIAASFVASGVTALIANFAYARVLGVITWDRENLAVVPMLVGGVVALIWRARLAQIGAAVLITAAWTFYFTGLQADLH